MKIITFDQIKNLNIPKKLFYEWTEELLQNKYETILPAKISMKYYDGDGFFNVMPTIIPSLGVCGIKTIIRNPNHIPVLSGDLSLYSLETNDLLAVMDATFITAYRTGSMAALAINTLAVKNYSEIGIIGLGNISRATLLILAETLNGRKVHIKLLKHHDTEKDFVALFEKYENLSFSMHEEVAEVVSGSDVVISAVTVANDIIAGPELFKEGALLVPIHTKGFQTCDTVFDKVIVDDHDHVKGFKYYREFKNCHELAEVLKNPEYGRTDDKQRIIAYNVGMAIQDIYFAKKIYDMFPDDGEVTISKNLPKYWVE